MLKFSQCFHLMPFNNSFIVTNGARALERALPPRRGQSWGAPLVQERGSSRMYMYMCSVHDKHGRLGASDSCVLGRSPRSACGSVHLAWCPGVAGKQTLPRCHWPDPCPASVPCRNGPRPAAADMFRLNYG